MQIEIQKLSVALGDRKVLTDIDLHIGSGSSVALIGKSGIGKTTLLRAIGGLIAPQGGCIRIGGVSPKDLYGTAKLTLLFQQAYLWQHLTVRENLELLYRVYRRRVDRVHISRQLQAVDLEEAAALYPYQLSAGMKARATIARALCIPPEVLLMDEPLAALDPVRRVDLNRVLRNTCRVIGATAVWITHDVVEALTFADRIIVVASASSVMSFDTRSLPAVSDSGNLPERTRELRDRIIAACWSDEACATRWRTIDVAIA